MIRTHEIMRKEAKLIPFQANYGHEGMNALIVDENVPDLILVRDFLSLSKLHFDNVMTCHPADVATLFNEKVFHLAFVGLCSDSMKVMETVAGLVMSNPSLTIIGLCDRYDHVFTEQLIRIGVNDVLVKTELNEHSLTKCIQFAMERKKANNELEFRAGELNNLFYRMYHDLRAPIPTLLGLLNLANKKLKASDPDGLIEKSLLCVNKFDNILYRMIEIISITEGPALMVPVNVRQLVMDKLNVYDRSAGSLVVDVDLPFEMLNSDEFILSNILEHLFDNAIKFKDPEKSLLHITVWGKETETDYIIYVSDNGRGIEEHHLARVFEMFYKADAEIRGNGLGLYFVKKCVDKLGGDVGLASKKGAGTNIRLSFPKTP